MKRKNVAQNFTRNNIMLFLKFATNILFLKWVILALLANQELRWNHQVRFKKIWKEASYTAQQNSKWVKFPNFFLRENVFGW